MTHKRKMIIGALLLTLGTLAAIVIWQFEKPGSLVWDHGFKYQTEQTMPCKLVTHELPVDPSKIASLAIDVKNADVKVVKGEQFKVTTQNWSSKVTTQVSFDDGQLTVKDSESEVRRLNFGIGIVIRSNQITITLPESQYLSLILAKSRNGDLDFDHVSVKAAEITATNADAKFERAKFDNLTVSNTNGDIQLKQTTIAFGGKITNQNGDIEIKDSRLPDFYAKTKWGDEDIRVSGAPRQSEQSQANFVVTAQNGDIEID